MGEPAGPAAGMSSFAPQGGPMVSRIVLGARLRRLREARGVTADDAGYAIRASQSKISRMELGRVGFKERDIVDLLDLYGVAEEGERQDILALAREANAPGWWHEYGDVMPGWFEIFVALEGAASHVRGYESRFVPELLQTPDYAHAVAAVGHDEASEYEIERRVSLRMRRRRLLSRPDAPTLWFVVDEAVLRRPVGGREVMLAQLEHLADMSVLPNVTLQVVAFRAPQAAGAGPFTILRFADPVLPDVVYLEQLTSALYLDKPSDLDAYARLFDRLCFAAEPPDVTRRILVELMSDLGG